ncbi:MAG: hypothetical protein A2X19_01055 [Bacteroidetes bacterium GWE2_39_28]|nr:MAG: hypothetical protein A2X19_01055 [Bacteroidetes bacterium GWE2_39_28]OFY12473.1 MAG: hypothetical protein A2X16_10980 [Bacteroidetes bacterium GWF2_39_10]OFZ10667.1 MAG: hypothetical protein A2465_01985 [Bacteroidetes bacterium RIFOXYC2_FULL_39_11]HCT93421.1 GSCFA domain protein [Rikenellaceae bacterium]
MIKQWQTLVQTEPLKERIKYSHKILFTGSCFAGEIGNRMQNLRFQTLVNPFGVLYNPASIALSLERIETEIPFSGDELIKAGDIYKSFMHSSEFASTSETDFLNKNNSLLKTASLHFKESRWIVITLGTSWVYREKKSQKIVSNCHKLPSDMFIREAMEADEIDKVLSDIIKRHPDKNWVLTVSPIRHFKEGANGNQLSKARLLLATNALVEKFSNVFYFPAYEIFMDELRDYRFYAEDMIHPSAESTDYIWEKFREFAVDASCESIMSDVTSLIKMKQHRPLFPESKDYREFLDKIAKLEAKIASKRL